MEIDITQNNLKVEEGCPNPANIFHNEWQMQVLAILPMKEPTNAADPNQALQED